MDFVTIPDDEDLGTADTLRYIKDKIELSMCLSLWRTGSVVFYNSVLDFTSEGQGFEAWHAFLKTPEDFSGLKAIFKIQSFLSGDGVFSPQSSTAFIIKEN